MPSRFGGFTLDESRRQLFGKAGPVHLTPKAFQLLSILIEERPRAVAKADLQERLWPATFVSEGNLAGLIVELRAALADDARDPQFVRTAYGFGYAFTSEVQEISEEPASNATLALAVGSPAEAGAPLMQPRKRAFQRVVNVAAALTLLAVSHNDFGQRTLNASTPARIRSIAVLPFKTDLSNPEDRHLGLGLADVLITRISRQRQLVVRPTSAIDKYDGAPRDSRSAGKELRVDAVLEGSIRRSGDRIRVTTQLVKVSDGRPIWGETIDENAADLFALEDSISRKVAEALTLELTRSEWEALKRRYTENTAAYDAYMKGRYFMHQRGAERRAKAIESLRKAIEHDPQYALAHATLAHAYGIQATSVDVKPRGAWLRSEAHALRALQLDPNLSEAHSAIGAVRMTWSLDWSVAEKEYIRALELDPHNALAQRQYAGLLQCLGRFEEAISARNHAIELDPLSVSARREAAWTYYLAGNYDKAIEQYTGTLELDPSFAHAQIGLGAVYAQKRDYPRAIEAGEKAVRMHEISNTLGWLGYIYGRAGRTDDARAMLKRLGELARKHPVSPQHFAFIYIGLGDHDEALRWLERAYLDRAAITIIKVEPALDPLRSDARFIDLLHRAGFVR